MSNDFSLFFSVFLFSSFSPDCRSSIDNFALSRPRNDVGERTSLANGKNTFVENRVSRGKREEREGERERDAAHRSINDVGERSAANNCTLAYKGENYRIKATFKLKLRTW